MLCSGPVETQEISIQSSRTKVRSECLRVWQHTPWCVARVYYILMHTYSGDMIIYIGVGINFVSFNSKGYLRTSTAGEQKWIPAFFVVQPTSSLIQPPYRVSVGYLIYSMQCPKCGSEILVCRLISKEKLTLCYVLWRIT